MRTGETTAPVPNSETLAPRGSSTVLLFPWKDSAQVVYATQTDAIHAPCFESREDHVGCYHLQNGALESNTQSQGI